MLNKAYDLSQNSASTLFLEFSLSGGSHTVGIINIPSSFKIQAQVIRKQNQTEKRIDHY